MEPVRQMFKGSYGKPFCTSWKALKTLGMRTSGSVAIEEKTYSYQLDSRIPVLSMKATWKDSGPASSAVTMSPALPPEENIPEHGAGLSMYETPVTYCVVGSATARKPCYIVMIFQDRSNSAGPRHRDKRFGESCRVALRPWKAH
jgi:hypothetical protein